MTQEEKQKEKELLLDTLKDGLPYGLQLQITDVNGFTFDGELRVLSKNWCKLNITDPVKKARVKNKAIPLNYIYIKPCLRPMLSMTEEELHEVQEILGKGVEIREDFMVSVDSSINSFTYLELIALFDWLNKHHFDYRGLIPKGLALEAPKGIYNIKTGIV